MMQPNKTRVVVACFNTECSMDDVVSRALKYVDRVGALRIQATSCQYNDYSSTMNPLIHGSGVGFSVIRPHLKSC